MMYNPDEFGRELLRSTLGDPVAYSDHVEALSTEEMDKHIRQYLKDHAIADLMRIIANYLKEKEEENTKK